MKPIKTLNIQLNTGYPAIRQMIQSLRVMPLIGLICCGISACASSVNDTEPPATVTAPHTAAQEARHLAEQGQYAAAAQQYEALASSLNADQKPTLLLQAAQWRLQAYQPKQALALIQAVRSQSLSSQQSLLSQLMEAQALAQLGQDQAAYARINTLPAELPHDLQARKLAVIAQIKNHQGDTLAALQALVSREQLLPDTASRKANDRWIWDILQQQPRANLDKLTRASANDIRLQAWLSLALISQNQRQNPQLFTKQWQAWQARFPNHPGAQFVQVDEPTSRLDDHSSVSLERVAVLLPFTGRYSAVANAIRDGMLAAYYEDHRPDSGIRQIFFYDSGESALNIVSIYQQALNDGAQAVVGPLAKEAITTLIRSGQIRTPVIALNQIENSLSPPPQLYQFTLAPEEEARQVAERAILDGHHRASALVPQGEWGTRILAAFTTRYQELGGQVVAHASYSNNTSSYGNVIKQLLRVADNTPGQRRTDIDMMFMAAFPTQGRLLRPLLNFNFAADLPVYATSHIYSGKANPDADQDLEGVIFPSMPWLISSEDFPAARQLARQWPNRFADQAQLFALGYDAFHLLTLTQDPELLRSFYAGATGKLHLEPNHVIDHQLQWASFAKGNITHVSNTAQTQTQPLNEPTH